MNTCTLPNNVTGKVKPQLSQSWEGKNDVLMMIVRRMSCFYLKMILMYGFIGSTCFFRIRIYCFAFSSTHLEMWVSIFFPPMFWVTWLFCFFLVFFCFTFDAAIFPLWPFFLFLMGNYFLCHHLDFPCDVFLCHYLDLQGDFLLCHIITFVMGCSYQNMSVFETGWSYRAIWFFRLLKGQEGARNCKVTANPLSWYWVHSLLQVNRSIMSCMKPRTNARLRERELCWIESVLLGPPVAARRNPRRCLRLRFACDAVTSTWQGTVWDPVPKTE